MTNTNNINFVSNTDTSKILNSSEIKTNTQLNTIFDVDTFGNNNGKIDEEDFQLAYTKNPTLKEKLEDLYVEFAMNNLGLTEEVGNYLVATIEMPFASNGTIDRRKIIKDKNTGKIIMKKNTLITTKEGITTVKVHKERFGAKDVKINDSEFQYSQELIEKYIIEESVDNFGNKITRFSSIPDIRNKSESERTTEEKQLLEEFDNMVKYIIESGIDYCIDPKLITSIIQQEVGFNGLSPKVVGINGKGYMQLTSAPVKDFLGYASDRRYHSTKVSQYGPELEELLISRGFNIQEAKTNAQKQELFSKIMDYLKTNKDAEFNIRFGTQILSYYMNKADGNVRIAAKNYNGSPHRETYSKNVSNYHQFQENSVPNDSTYTYQRRILI